MTDTAGRDTMPSPTPASDAPAPAPRIPLHPPLAHIAIGAYTTAVVFDLLSIARVAGSATTHALYQGGTYALMVGTTALILAVVTGLMERSGRTAAGSRERRAANRHGILMSLVGVVAVVDIVIRRHASAGAAHTSPAVFVITAVLAVLLAVGGRIGGKLVYKLGVGRAAGAASQL